MEGDKGMVVIYTTVGEAEEAKAMARVLVEAGLVACANVMAAHTAIYRWEGRVMENPEIGMILKASEAKYEAAVERLFELHPYETPVIVWWAADAVPETLEWIGA